MTRKLPFRLLSLIFGLMTLTTAAYSETDTGTKIFDNRFRTLKTESADNFMAPPVIRMGTNDRITIKFDEIGEDNSFLEYRLVHCNADWKPSRLIESEYIDGFNSQRIEDYAFSTATFVHYVNYMITIPNEDMTILHSGNYLLQVYDPDSPDDILLQTRFQVTENSVWTDGIMTTRTDKGHNTEWQQISFNIDTEGFGKIDPFQDLTITIDQNHRDVTRRNVKSPLRVSGNRIVYDHLPDLIFPASNEYRRFESTSNSFTGLHVDSLRYMGSNYHVWLKPDSERVGSQYSYDQTQHGRFMVHEYNATDSDIGADYITVHFMLETEGPINGEVYIDGEFTHNVFDESNRMTFDKSLGAYIAQIPLKQGAYNYQYVVKSDFGNPSYSTSAIEGNKYETSNEYGVSVYFHPPGSRGDRLISYRVIE